MTEPPMPRPFSGSALFCRQLGPGSNKSDQRARPLRPDWRPLTLRIAITAYLQPYHTPLTLIAWVRSQIFSSVLTASSSLGSASSGASSRPAERRVYKVARAQA